MPETSAARRDSARDQVPSSTTPAIAADEHEKAARCHEVAAALCHEAARFYAEGDAANARECTKQALEQSRRAAQFIAKWDARIGGVMPH